MQQATHICQIADLHIGSSPNRYEEYIAVFKTLFQKIATFPNSIVVVAGDVFHHKNKLSAADINAFNEFCAIGKTRVLIVIPGNHDANLNNSGGDDLISPLIKIGMGRAIKNGDNIAQTNGVYYVRDSAHFTANGVEFQHHSVFDTTKPTPAPNKVFLYHGMVNSAKIGLHAVSGQKVGIKELSAAKITLLGDIHKMQFLAPNVAYSGSLIQQNIGEDTEKGFILWQLNNATGKFIKIENDSAYIKLDPRNCDLRAQPQPKKILSLSVVAPTAEDIKNIETLYGRKIDRIIRKDALAIQSADHGTVLESMLKQDAVPDDKIAKILNLHHFHFPPNALRTKWHVKKMEWSNIYKYRAGNCIDISIPNTIIGIIAPNKSGKSSVFDILTFSLFNECIRGGIKDMVNKKERTGFIATTITTDHGVDYRIELAILLKSVSAHALYKIVDGREENITGTTLAETYKTFSKIVGTFSNFISSNIYSQDNVGDILRLQSTQKTIRLMQLFGIGEMEGVIEDVSKTINSIKKETKACAEIKYKNHDTEIQYITAEISNKEKLLQNVRDENVKWRTIMVQNEELLNKVPAEIEDYKRRITHYKSKLAVNITTENMNPNVKLLDALKRVPRATTAKTPAELRAEKEQLMNVQHSIPEDRIQQIVDILQKYPQPQTARIATLRKEIERLNQVCGGTLDALQALLLRYNKELAVLKINTLKFNASCAQCQNNKQLTGGDAKRISEKEASIIALKHKIAEAVKRAEYEKELAVLQQRESPDINLYNEVLAAKNRAKQIDAEIEKWAAWESAQKQIKEIHNYIAQVEYISNVTELKKCEQEYDKLNTAHDLKALAAELAHATNLYKECEAREIAIMEDLNALRHKLYEYCEDKKQHELNKNLQPKLDELEICEMYKYYIKHKNINTAFIKEKLQTLQTLVNDILNNMRAGFTLECEINDRNTICFRISELGDTISYDLASGFQKFVTAIAVRIALTKLVQFSCANIFIDEGFGCMDEENMLRVNEILQNLKLEYQNIFIISHIQEIDIDLKLPIINNQITTTPTQTSTATVEPAVTSSIAQLSTSTSVSAAALNNFVCECGMTIKKSSRAAHIKTKKHCERVGNKKN